MDISAIIESPTQRLRALIAERRKKIEERRFAARVCAEAVAALHVVQAQQPGLQGSALYEAVVAERTRLDAGQARAIVRGAQESLEDWGNDRDATLIDVVKYMIVSEYLGQEALEDGMSIDLGDFLSRHIDTQL